MIEEISNYQSPASLSSPASELSVKKAVPSIALTTGAHSDYRSLISPLIPHTRSTKTDVSIPNWLQTWSSSQLNKTQMEAANIKLILEKKIATQKPSYEEISQANMKVKSLHYY